MNTFTRPDLAMQLLLHDEHESVWRAELAPSVPLDGFQLQDVRYGSNLLLRDCSLKFAQQCGYASPLDLQGLPINRMIFGQRIEDLVVHTDARRLPHIVNFISVHAPNGTTGHGYLNCIGLIASDAQLLGMLGRRRDITHQLKKKEERRELEESLTVKEYKIFLSLVKGKTVKQIASSVGMTEKTVYFHIENIERKMHTCGILDIVQKAYRLGFFDSTEAES